jgi:hypothetical protein
MASIETKFFEFRQNNSGGSFHRNENVDTRVFIEAVDADHANARALKVGIYFDGCSTGSDCDCCGDRWYETGDHNAVESEDDITVYRSKFGPEPHGDVPLREALEAGCSLGSFNDCGVIIHRLDGTKAAYRGPGFKAKESV